MKKSKISKSLLEIWEIKEKAYQEVKDMNINDAILKRLNDSASTASKLGFKAYIFPQKVGFAGKKM